MHPKCHYFHCFPAACAGLNAWWICYFFGRGKDFWWARNFVCTVFFSTRVPAYKCHRSSCQHQSLAPLSCTRIFMRFYSPGTYIISCTQNSQDAHNQGYLRLVQFSYSIPRSHCHSGHLPAPLLAPEAPRNFTPRYKFKHT